MPVEQIAGETVYCTASLSRLQSAMELVNSHHPRRAILRCKAKMQLLQAADDNCFDWPEVTDALLNQLAATLFESTHYQALYQGCQSKQQAGLVDQQLVAELVSTYQHLLERQQDPVVQSLNARLARL